MAAANRASRIPPSAAYGLAGLAGVLYFLGFAGFGLWPLSLVALVPLFALLDLGPWTRGQTLRLGLWFGLITNLGGYYWLIPTMEAFSGFSKLPSTFFALVVCLYQGGLLALFFALCVRARTRGVPVTWAAVAALPALELLYPLLFPSYYGTALHSLPHLIQIADLGGPMLVTSLAVWVNGAVYETLRARMQRRAWPKAEPLVALAAVAATLAYGSWRIADVDARVAEAPKIDVGLVQVNMGVFEKHADPNEGHRRHLEQSRELERQGNVDLLVWPESAINFVIPSHVQNVQRHVLEDIRTPVLFGGLARREVDEVVRVYNTAFLADAQGAVRGTYDKTYLLAFAEYLPGGDTFPILYDWSPRSGRFSKGTHVNPLQLGAYRISALICYEDILPGFVRAAVRTGKPHLLVNITNDAWFGDTHEPWIHLALAKFRAVEHHRYLVRATNSGVSAVVDPVGRVVSHTGVYTRANLQAEVAMLSQPTWYGWLGNWPGWLGLVGSLWFAFVHKPRRVVGDSSTSKRPA